MRAEQPLVERSSHAFAHRRVEAISPVDLRGAARRLARALGAGVPRLEWRLLGGRRSWQPPLLLDRRDAAMMLAFDLDHDDARSSAASVLRTDRVVTVKPRTTDNSSGSCTPPTADWIGEQDGITTDGRSR